MEHKKTSLLKRLVMIVCVRQMALFRFQAGLADLAAASLPVYI